MIYYALPNESSWNCLLKELSSYFCSTICGWLSFNWFFIFPFAPLALAVLAHPVIVSIPTISISPTSRSLHTMFAAIPSASSPIIITWMLFLFFITSSNSNNSLIAILASCIGWLYGLRYYERAWCGGNLLSWIICDEDVVFCLFNLVCAGRS